MLVSAQISSCDLQCGVYLNFMVLIYSPIMACIFFEIAFITQIVAILMSTAFSLACETRRIHLTLTSMYIKYYVDTGSTLRA